MDEAIPKASFLFDLDGNACRQCLSARCWHGAKRLDVEGINVAVWRIHRKIRHERRFVTTCFCAKRAFTSIRAPAAAPQPACRGVQSAIGFDSPASPAP
jgi:hypothetical protein